MQKFLVEVTETLVRKVIIEADTRYDAVEAAETLCNNGVIDLDGKDFSSRNCQCIGTANDEDMGIEIHQDPEIARLEAEAKEAIEVFCQNEYQEDVDFSDLTKIPLLYTDDEKEGFEYKVEVFANLPERSISTYVSGILVSCVKQKTLADFVDTLQFLDFDAYAEISDEEWEAYWASFHQSKENVIVSATYITEWEGGARFSYPCKVNLETREIFAIGHIDPDEIADYNCLLGEFVRFEDGREYYAIDKDRSTCKDDDFWYRGCEGALNGGEANA